MVLIFFPTFPLNSDDFHSLWTAWVSGAVIPKISLTDFWGKVLTIYFTTIIVIKYRTLQILTDMAMNLNANKDFICEKRIKVYIDKWLTKKRKIQLTSSLSSSLMHIACVIFFLKWPEFYDLFNTYGGQTPQNTKSKLSGFCEMLGTKHARLLCNIFI